VLFSPTAYTADILVDRVSCQLPDAIIAANTDASVNGCSAGSGPDRLLVSTENGRRIIFGRSLPATNNALPIITSFITIEPTNVSLLLSRPIGPRTPKFRFFEVSESGSLTLKQVVLDNGNLSDDNAASGGETGGAIFNRGRLNLHDVDIVGSEAGRGGAIAMLPGSTNVILNSILRTNRAVLSGGGISITGSSSADIDTSLRIEDSVITFNVALSSNSDISSRGGGLSVTGNVNVSILRSVISYNTSFQGNTILLADGGGMLISTGARVRIFDTTFTDNSTGGIGSAISFIGSNMGLSLINSTVVNNSGPSSAAALDLTLNGNSFILRNTIVSGSGRDLDRREISMRDVNMANSLELQNNLIGHSGITTAEAIQIDLDSVQTVAELFDESILLTSDSSTPTSTDAIYEAVLNEQGLNEHYILVPNSPAIDAATDSIISGFPLAFFAPGCRGDRVGILGGVDSSYRVDQIGTRRPQGNACDIGAIELIEEFCFVIPLKNNRAVVPCL